MTATLGSLEFDEVDGVVTPRTVPVVEEVENPALVDATVSLDMGQRSSLAFRGFFAASPVADLFALVDTVVTADDETGTAHTVKVMAVRPRSRPGRCRGVAGRWVEVEVEVKPWA